MRFSVNVFVLANVHEIAVAIIRLKGVSLWLQSVTTAKF